MVVRFDNTSFGRVTVGGKTYNHDIYLYPDGKIKLRPSSHVVKVNEIDTILKSKPEVVVVGTGQAGCVNVDKKAIELLDRFGVELIQDETPIAIRKFNELVDKGKSVACIIHVTC